MVSDPIADMLTRLRNGIMAHHESVLVPASKTKLVIAKILKDEGFITDFEIIRGKPAKMIKVTMRYRDRVRSYVTGLERVSRPGLRVYVGRREIPRVYGGLGIAILSTPKGVVTGHEAWKRKLGGELLCYVW